MTIAEAIDATYLMATGKTTLATTSSKYTRIVSLLNYFQRRWAREPGVDWNSLYDPAFSIGTIIASDTYDIDTTAVRKMSDREGDTVRIVHSDGVGYTDYSLVAHDALKDYYWGANKESYNGFYCTQIGSSLVFNHTFTSDDPQYGGEILAPVYIFPDEITSDSVDDIDVQVDDPDWLVTRTAAEYVRNDITRRQRYPELLAMANEIMERMKDDNEGQVDTINMPWTPTSGIPGVSSDSTWSS